MACRVPQAPPRWGEIPEPWQPRAVRAPAFIATSPADSPKINLLVIALAWMPRRMPRAVLVKVLTSRVCAGREWWQGGEVK